MSDRLYERRPPTCPMCGVGLGEVHHTDCASMGVFRTQADYAAAPKLMARKVAMGRALDEAKARHRMSRSGVVFAKPDAMPALRRKIRGTWSTLAQLALNAATFHPVSTIGVVAALAFGLGVCLILVWWGLRSLAALGAAL